MAARTRLVVGTMSGTSLDGLDACLVEVIGEGLELQCRVIKGTSQRFPAELAAGLRALAERQPKTAEEITRLVHSFSLFHVDVIKDVMPQEPLSLIALHGQTVFHAPPLSWQMVNPTLVAHALQCTVVCDMRAADLASGGQGAPITPLADKLLFGRDLTKTSSRAIVNLGGFCNVTVLRGDDGSVEGRDVCACNQLLDKMASLLLGIAYDADGSAASSGTRADAVVDETIAFLASQLELRRSLGTAEDPTQFAQQLGSRHPALSTGDLLRSCCAAVASVISASLGGGVTSVVLAGGGARNKTLVTELCECLPNADVQLSSAYGIDVEYREAAEMALLGALCQDNVPITLPAVTRCAESVVAGLWAYPTRPRPRVAPTTPANPTSLLLEPPADRSGILTEQRNPNSMELHTASIDEVVGIIQGEDFEVMAAMKSARPALVSFIEELVKRFELGGRLIYVGCGTSGRLGVLDAAECGPTFNIEPGRVIGLIAGGDKALRTSSEGAEDDPLGAIKELQALGVDERDAVVGIAAGGTTPYVLNALRHMSTERRPLTALITCTPLPAALAVEAYVPHVITLPTGPEVVTGSTRV